MAFRPVTQSRTGFGRGNCTEASIASLLGVELDLVPDLWAGPNAGPSSDDQQPLANRIRLWEWLKREHGVQLCGVHLAQPAEFASEAYLRACRVLQGIGDQSWARHHLFFGLHPSGVPHYVVGERGRVVWDPNPARAGLKVFHGVDWLVPLDLLSEDALRLPAAEWREQPQQETA